MLASDGAFNETVIEVLDKMTEQDVIDMVNDVKVRRVQRRYWHFL